MAALSYFDEWNGGKEPAEIFRALPQESRTDFDSFHKRLVSVWELTLQVEAPPTGTLDVMPGLRF